MRGNPIPEIIPDKLYFVLKSMDFLNERSIRDYYLKKKFNELRSMYSRREIFRILQKEFPYICEDTIRKIIYTRCDPAAEDDSSYSRKSKRKWNIFAEM